MKDGLCITGDDCFVFLLHIEMQFLLLLLLLLLLLIDKYMSSKTTHAVFIHISSFPGVRLPHERDIRLTTQDQ